MNYVPNTTLTNSEHVHTCTLLWIMCVNDQILIYIQINFIKVPILNKFVRRVAQSMQLHRVAWLSTL